jgi:hypothetical protein
MFSLKNEVQSLRGTNQEMSSILISLYGSALGKGLLRREPEFGQQLQLAIERFLVLASASADDMRGGKEGDGTQYDDTELNRHTNGQKTFLKRHHQEIAPAFEPSLPSTASVYGGNILSNTGSTDINMEYRFGHKYKLNWHEEGQYRNGQPDVQIRKKPTEDSAGPPSDFLDLQQYPMEVPQTQDFSHTFLSRFHMPCPNAYNAHHEYSFAQRIQRGAIETSLKIITSTDPSMEQRVQQIFGLSLLSKSKETIIARLQMLIGCSAWDSLYGWSAPLIHRRGADAYYPVHQKDANREVGYQFHAAYSMDPFSPTVAQTQEALGSNVKHSLHRFNDDFLNPDDVEEYLRGRGLDILPAAEFVTVNLDVLGLSEAPLQKSSVNNIITSMMAPSGPHDLNGCMPPNAKTQPNAFSLDSVTYDNALVDIETSAFQLAYTDWNSNGSLTANNNSVNSTFYMKPGRNTSTSTSEIASSASGFGNRRIATINANTLLDSSSSILIVWLPY